MQKRYFFILIFSLIVTSVSAQTVLKGTVYENGSSTRLDNVFVHDNNSKQYTLTDKHGNFQIKTEAGHTLIFDSPSYKSDTLYVVDLTFKTIQMIAKTISLREVNINSTRVAFDPHKEYPDVYTKSKVYVLSPSSWFSKKAKMPAG